MGIVMNMSSYRLKECDSVEFFDPNYFPRLLVSQIAPYFASVSGLLGQRNCYCGAHANSFGINSQIEQNAARKLCVGSKIVTYDGLGTLRGWAGTKYPESVNWFITLFFYLLYHPTMGYINSMSSDCPLKHCRLGKQGEFIMDAGEAPLILLGHLYKFKILSETRREGSFSAQHLFDI